MFLNFLASHDGVGLTSAKGLVDERSFKKTLNIALQRGALISYKAAQEGLIPYELNCSYLSVVAPPELGGLLSVPGLFSPPRPYCWPSGASRRYIFTAG